MKSTATEARASRTFRSGVYLERLMAELDRAAIAARIGQARTEAGLTQVELGEALEPPVHFRTIQTWESVKEPRPPWSRLDEIGRIVGKSKDWILHGHERPVGLSEDAVNILAALDRKIDVEVIQRLERIEQALRDRARQAEQL